jgi:hypothetical protein
LAGQQQQQQQQQQQLQQQQQHGLCRIAAVCRARSI